MPAVTRSQVRNNAEVAVADVGAPATRDADPATPRRRAGVHREVLGAGDRAVRGGRGARRGGRAGPNANRGAGAFRAVGIGRGRGLRVGVLIHANIHDVRNNAVRNAVREYFGLSRNVPIFYISAMDNPIFNEARNVPHPNPDVLRPPPRRYPRFRGEYRCYICKRRYLEREPTAIPPCGHIFCGPCIRGREEPRCPYCAVAYHPNSLRRIYLN